MSLSTLIVQREIASIREVEEALARQVLYGGDLITNLLEVCRVDEAVLLPIVAESFGLPPAQPGELPRPPEDAKRLVGAEVALERNLAPLVVDRHGLTVAVAEPLSADAEQELAFALALPIAQKIAPLVRIRQALARDYGVPVDKRLQRLLVRMVTEEPRSRSDYPPPMLRRESTKLEAPRPPSILPPPRSSVPEPLRPSTVPGVPGVPGAPGPTQTLVRRTEVPPGRPLRRRRGPLTAEVAKQELDDAIHRDTIFDLVFEFARQYFDYAAYFLVHGEIAEGRDAFGEGAPREKVARIAVPLDLPSVLSIAREKKAPIERVPSSEGLDVVLMSDFGRSGKTVCVVIPVVVRTRVVALLLGDGGETGIDKASLAEVEEMIGAATAAFERIIVRRKLKGTVPPPDVMESVPPQGASIAPATKVSEDARRHDEVMRRPAAEELAAPIRDLMTEPVSRPAATTRDPVIEARVPAAAPTAPLPDNVLAVRRPSGRPIPREEPASAPNLPASVASASTPLAVVSTAPRNLRRAQAPAFEFGTSVPARTGFDSEPATSRDPVPTQVSRDSGSHPAAPAASAASATPAAPVAASEPEPPHSPKAESPPSMPAVRPVAVTDMSPGTLPVLEPPADGRASTPGLLISPDDSDVDVVDHSYDYGETPVAPPVSFEETPAAPSVEPSSPAVGPPSPKVVVRSSLPTSTLTSMPGLSEPRRPMPESEQQVSVAPHRPPSSRSDHTNVLPSVIVDVASEYVGLVDRVLEGGDDDAEVELLRAGGYAMPAIMAKFPGPITMENERLEEGPLPRVAECGPVLRLVASQRRTAMPFVLSHVEDPEVDKRFWATYLLTELVYPDVLDPIVSRVFDADKRVRRVARAAAKAFAEVSPQAIVERLELVAMDASKPRSERVLAVEALGATYEAAAVPAIVPLLDDPDSQVVSAVRASLVILTRQDFGAATEKWRAWYAANKERHRVEWLIDALMHDQASIRAAAGEELKTTTKEYFGYYDDLPKRERERAQARYREWWSATGKVRFSRASSSRG